MSIASLKADLNKRFGKNAVVIASEAKGLIVRRFSTGVFALDEITKGGYPEGRVVELIGPEHSGKTLLAMRAVRSFLKKHKDALCVWVDTENTFDPTWAESNGLDLSRLVVNVPSSGEEGCDLMLASMASDDLVIVVLDSMAMLVPTKDIDKDMEDGKNVGSHPGMITEFVKKLTIAMRTDLTEDKPKSTLIVLNQLRSKIGMMFGDPESIPGGKAKDHASSMRIRIRREKWLQEGTKEKKENVGYNVQFRVKKTKVGGGIERTGETEFYFRDVDEHRPFGFNNILALRKSGVMQELIEVQGNSYTYGKIKGVGKAFDKALREDKAATKKLRKDLMAIATKKLGKAPSEEAGE